MKKPPAVPSLGRFLRGLFITGLGLLLPVQLGLLWLASLDAPVHLPAGIAETLTERLAKQGLRLQARDLWILPDQSLAADDLTLEVIGLTGEIFTADRMEIGVSLPDLLAGRINPTRVRVRGGKLWCPASVSQLGQGRLLAEDIRLEARREGRWLMVPSLLARSGKFAATFHGELPAALVQRGASDADADTAEATPQRVARALRVIEDVLLVADHSGGASLNLEAKGEAEGGARLAGHAVLGNDWSQEGLGLIQAREMLTLVRARLDARGGLKSWQAQVSAKNLSFRQVSARSLALKFDGTDVLTETQGQLSLDEVSVGTFTGLSVRTTLTRTESPDGRPGLRARFRASTALSSAQGLALWTPTSPAAHKVDQLSIRIPDGQIAAEDLRRALPDLDAALAPANGDLAGVLTVADLHIRYDGAWRASGAAGFSGLQAFGLSPRAISPAEGLPFSTGFTYNPDRAPYALQLRDLHLASVSGEADLSLDPGGPFALRLRGELQPSALDQLLGDWWVSLWKLFEVERRPYATIDVTSHWGDHSSEVRGRVRLEDFRFMHAPFRSVEVLVDANSKGTRIGLHRLTGVGPDGGQLEGTAIWDWTKKGPAAGPVVGLRGNLQPWIAASTASPEIGEALRGLRLPSDHLLSLDVHPATAGLDIQAHVACAAEFTAWGIASRGLSLDVSSRAQDLDIRAGLALADGQATLRIQGDPLKESRAKLVLRGCDPKKIAKIAELIDPPKTDAPVPETKPATPGTPGKLDLDFAGSIHLQKPKLLKGLGNFELTDPDLKRVRILGGVSTFLEAIGIKATSYDLTQASGRFGCLDGRAYFPDLVIKGPDARLTLAGEVDLLASTLDFEGDFSLPKKGGFNPLDYLNINRAFLSLSRVRIKGPISNPETSSLVKLSDILNPQKDSNLGKIPPSLLE